MSVEEVGAIWGTIGKVEVWTAKKAYRTAQNLGMKYQNWRHKGAGESGSTTPATTSEGGSGKNQWKSDEQYQSTTYMNTITYRKRKK